MPLTISVSHNAEIAHRITGLAGAAQKCRNVHGHSLWITWTFAAPDHTGSAIEFGVIKSQLRGWVDQHLDHGFVCHEGDPIGHTLADLGLKVLALPCSPTTEAITEWLAAATRALLPTTNLLSVQVQESRTAAATWSAA